MILNEMLRFNKWFFLKRNPDSRRVRFQVLAGVVAYTLFVVGFVYIEFLQDKPHLQAVVTTYVVPVIIGMPTLAFLWIFRTRDVRQQIDKLQKKIDQDHFNHAVENLTNIGVILINANSGLEQNSQQSLSDMTKEAIGVQSLIELSKTTSKFNELITIIFQNKKEEFEKYDFKYNKFRCDSRKKLIIDMDEWLKAHPNPKE